MDMCLEYENFVKLVPKKNAHHLLHVSSPDANRELSLCLLIAKINNSQLGRVVEND